MSMSTKEKGAKTTEGEFKAPFQVDIFLIRVQNIGNGAQTFTLSQGKGCVSEETHHSGNQRANKRTRRIVACADHC